MLHMDDMSTSKFTFLFDVCSVNVVYSVSGECLIMDHNFRWSYAFSVINTVRLISIKS